MTRRSLFILAILLALTACRLDVTVAVDMEPDGTGVVAVAVEADSELVDQVPGIEEDLRLDDAIASGWTVDGPAPTDGGGLSVTLTHEFRSAEELANVLNSIGPPLTDMAVARTTQDDVTTNAIDGQLVLAGGYESFADADLIAAVGGLPFGEEITASGLTPDEAMSFTFRVSLPGELVSSESGVEVDQGFIEWQAPLDGTAVSLRTQTVQRPASAVDEWAGPVSTVALVLLIVWLVVATAFIVFVAVARARKRRRRDRALRNLT